MIQPACGSGAGTALDCAFAVMKEIQLTVTAGQIVLIGVDGYTSQSWGGWVLDINSGC